MNEETFEEFRDRINKEIKDKGLKSKQPEYHRLKQQIAYRKNSAVKITCPTCGASSSKRFLEREHTCFYDFFLT